jgi:single-strand DNA-binding protein
MNKVFLLGNLGADPELKDFDGNTKLRFRLATSYKWRDKASGELKEHTEWHTLAMWGKRAEALAGILSKGSRVMVEGRLETRSYQVDGATKYVTEVKVEDLFLAGRGTKGRDEPEYHEIAA